MLDLPDYDEVVQRIQLSYASMDPQTQHYFQRILMEISDEGVSKTYEDLWLQDYKEIPVDIDTFVSDPRFLGNATNNGDAIYPHWREVLRDIFNAGNKYNEVIFTGATRIGKSSTGITATAYMLYKLMCLRDPQKFFGKKDVSKFSILFFNLTEKLAKGVAYREFQDTLFVSPWFQEHGKFSKSERNFYYIPEGNKVVVDYGSDASHALGQQVFVGFCLVGSTKVIVDNQVQSLESLRGSSDFEVLSWDGNTLDYKQAGLCDITKYVNDTIRVTLEDGSIIEGTEDHKVLLSSGEYISLSDLTIGDDLFQSDSRCA